MIRKQRYIDGGGNTRFLEVQPAKLKLLLDQHAGHAKFFPVSRWNWGMEFIKNRNRVRFIMK